MHAAQYMQKMTALTVAVVILLCSQGFAQADYILRKYNNGEIGFIRTSGTSNYTYTISEQNNGIGINYWSITQSGRTFRVRVKWQVWTNHVPVTYVNYFGDWQPNTELARGSLYGEIPESNDEFTDEFSFTAPSTPGWYRIRFMWILAYSPVESFYGGLNPGSYPHAFGEMAFRVGYPITNE